MNGTIQMLKNDLEHVRCNICKSNNYKIIYEARYDKEKDKDIIRKFRSSADELLIDQLVECNNCKLRYINPRFNENQIIKGYSEGDDPVFVSQVKAREKTFQNQLKVIERYAKKGNLLDIGTAGGSFLYIAKNKGWNVSGCEPNKWLVKWAKENYKIDINQGTLFEQKYKNNSFDVVTLWDVIEHTSDPLKVLQKCNLLLKNDGILVVNYPDIGSWIARLMKRKWLFLTSVHLYYFNRRTIEIILKKAGFKIIMIKPHFQRLQLGYIFKRISEYSKLLSNMGLSIVKSLGLADIEVPYWFGQTFIIANKKKDNKVFNN